ncbi:MAG: hypothetical protein JST63_00815 [Bacteroidetes bacterium]|nr:hypothetical protein [Bacteroidota bacterium]
MYKPISFAIAAIMVLSCSKTNESEPVQHSLNGNYTGTFKRFNINEDKTANVTIKIEEGQWTGNSNIQYYPAISSGVASVGYDNEVIKFVNKTPWTANFDWSYILDGSYLLHRNNDSLIFTRSYGNGAVDVYRLAKMQ